MARDIVSGSAPMNVSAVYSGKKGKGKGKGKCEDKDKEAAANPDAEVICHHRKGLRKRDCPTVEKEKPRKLTARERRRTGTRSRSRCQLDPSDNASTNQHD